MCICICVCVGTEICVCVYVSLCVSNDLFVCAYVWQSGDTPLHIAVRKCKYVEDGVRHTVIQKTYIREHINVYLLYVYI